MSHIRTKICGITRLEDATAAVAFGADAIGFNFYPKSKRFVDPGIAAEISLLHSTSISIFGVFVNSSVAEVTSIAKQTDLSHVQLHGDEDPRVVNEIRNLLPEVLIARAIRVSDNMSHAQSEIDIWLNAGIDLLLLDAATPGEFGGTGHRLDWKQVADLSMPKDWLLAGGLTSNNVYNAIELAKPYGVDVASGVEDSPGIKNEAKMQQFIKQANRHDNFKDND